MGCNTVVVVVVVVAAAVAVVVVLVVVVVVVVVAAAVVVVVFLLRCRNQRSCLAPRHEGIEGREGVSSFPATLPPVTGHLVRVD